MSGADIHAARILKAGRRYMLDGLHVVLLHGIESGHCTCALGAACNSAGKHPRFRQWRESASVDADDLHGWISDYPLSNIGLVTGADVELAVIDVDVHDRKNGLAELRRMQDVVGKLPPTRAQRTPRGGWHFFYRCTTPTRTCQNVRFCASEPAATGVDIRGDRNGQVVVAPSVNAQGREWRWANDRPIAELPAVYAKAFAPGQTTASSGFHSPHGVNHRRRGIALEALATFNPHDRGDWVLAGMALKHEFRESGDSFYRALWHAWGTAYLQWSLRESEQQWDSFRRESGVSFGTLQRRARTARGETG